MVFFKILFAAVILAAVSFFCTDQVTLNINSGLLALIAVGIFGLIRREEVSDSRIGPVTIGIGFFAFITAFVLSSNDLLGYEKMTAVLLSFIAVGIIGLATINKNQP